MQVKNGVFLISFLGIIVIVLLVILLWPSGAKTAVICFLPDCFKVEVARTDAEHERGLMNRMHLDQDSGMLFVFEKEGNYPFWMKNTLIPLDMIWLDKDKNVVFIAQNVQPCKDTCNSQDPRQQAMYVLEINGGLAQQLGLKIGQKAQF